MCVYHVYLMSLNILHLSDVLPPYILRFYISVMYCILTQSQQQFGLEKGKQVVHSAIHPPPIYPRLKVYSNENKERFKLISNDMFTFAA